MRASTAARWSRALWLCVGLTVVGATSVLLASGRSNGYAVTAVADAEYALRLVIPLAVGYVAYLSGQLAPYVDRARGGRSWARGMGALLWPALLAPPVAYLVVVVVVVVANDSGVSVPQQAVVMVGTGVALTIGWSVVGVVLGSVLPQLAAPGLALALYLLLTWLPALATPWPRLLTGIQYGCCSAGQQPVGASLGFATAIAVLLLVVAAISATASTRARRAIMMSLASVTASAGLVAAAVTLPIGQQYVLAEPRTSETVCAGSAPQVCLWPEHEGEIDVVAQWVNAAYQSWSNNPLGEDPPQRLSDAMGEGGPHYLGYTVGVDEGQLVANAAYADLMARGGGTRCAAEVPHVQAASVWLVHEAGLPVSSLQLSPDVQDEAHRVIALSTDGQRAWLEEVLQGLRACRS